MTDDGQDLIRRAVAAFEDGDAEAFAACFDPQGEFRLPRNLLEGGSYYGHAGVRRAVADAYETWSGFRFTVDDITVAAGGLVVHARVMNLPRGDGPPVEYRATYAVRVGAAGITYWTPSDGPDDALATLGRVR